MSKYKRPAKWRPDGPTRTSTGSSIRGKISAPIPIVDDEFPMRTSGAGVTPLAQPVDKEDIERQAQQIVSAAASLHDNASQDGPAQTAAVDQTTPEPPIPIPIRPPYEIPVQPLLQASMVRNSITSRRSATSPPRKKSSLRSVFSRLFGRKRGSGGSSMTSKSQAASKLRAGQHRSDPIALNRSSPKGSTRTPQRSASLPITEFNRALRSHSAGPDEFPVTVEETKTTPESTRAAIPTRPRGATSPNITWTPNIAAGYMGWTGLTPRPANIQARGTDDEAEAQIGVAVTSGSHPNRRSRSLNGLRDAAPTITRRRSDEIRYWRESYDPGAFSPISDFKQEGDEHVPADEQENDTTEVKDQPQPFNFGGLGEMAGMKITQAASLETRVSALEIGMGEMEKAVAQIHHRIASDHIVLLEPPKRNADRLRGSSAPRLENSSLQARDGLESGNGNIPNRASFYGSSRPSTVSTSHSFPRSAVENVDLPKFVTYEDQTRGTSAGSSQNAARPLSTSTTIRGLASSSPPFVLDKNITTESYRALTDTIMAERAARQRLEELVFNLQQQIHTLRSTAISASYHAPISDQANALLNEHSRGRSNFSSFEQDDSSDDEDTYSNKENFPSPDDDKGHFVDGVFGINTPEEATTPGRRMSLSQLTLGKRDAQQHGVDF